MNKTLIKLFNLIALCLSITTSIMPAAHITPSAKTLSREELLAMPIDPAARALLMAGHDEEGKGEKRETPPAKKPSAYKKMRKYVAIKQVIAHLGGNDKPEDISLLEILEAVVANINSHELPFINIEALNNLINIMRAKKKIKIEDLTSIIKKRELAIFLNKTPEELDQYGKPEKICALLIKMYETGKVTKKEIRDTFEVHPILRDFSVFFPRLVHYFDTDDLTLEITKALMGEETIDIKKSLISIGQSTKIENIIELFTDYKAADLAKFINFTCMRNLMKKRNRKELVTRDDVRPLFNLDNFLKYINKDPEDYQKHISPRINIDDYLDIVVHLVNFGVIKKSLIDKIDFSSIENMLSYDPGTLKTILNPYGSDVAQVHRLEDVIQTTEAHWAYRMQGAMLAIGALASYYCARAYCPQVTSYVDATAFSGLCAAGVGGIALHKIKKLSGLKDKIYNFCSNKAVNAYNYLNVKNLNIQRLVLNTGISKVYKYFAEPVTDNIFLETLTNSQIQVFQNLLVIGLHNPEILKANEEFMENLDDNQKIVLEAFVDQYRENKKAEAAKAAGTSSSSGTPLPATSATTNTVPSLSSTPNPDATKAVRKEGESIATGASVSSTCVPASSSSQAKVVSAHPTGERKEVKEYGESKRS